MNECLVLEGKKVGKQASGNLECAPTSPACGYLWGLSNVIPLWREPQTSAFCSSKNLIPRKVPPVLQRTSPIHTSAHKSVLSTTSLPPCRIQACSLPLTALPWPRSCRFARPGLSLPAAWELLGGLLRSEKVQAAFLSTACYSRLWFGPGGGAG